MPSLAEEFPKEQKRVRELRDEYLKLPPESGALSAAIMKVALDSAEQAVAQQDVVKMLRCYEQLKGFE